MRQSERISILNELQTINADIQLLEKFKARSEFLDMCLEVSRNRQKYLLKTLINEEGVKKNVQRN